jgi:hypothetical protein
MFMGQIPCVAAKSARLKHSGLRESNTHYMRLRRNCNKKPDDPMSLPKALYFVAY